jgi:hypothetical protein
MNRVIVPLVVLLVLGSLVPAGAAAQEEQVTLTVSVVNQDGTAVGGATIEATWSDGSTTATSASNGKAFVDVPKGAFVSLQIDHDTYVRNVPVTVNNAREQSVTITVARKGSAALRIADSDGALEGATVEVKRNGRTIVSGETNSQGVFTTGTIEQGEYTLVHSKTGYYTNRTTLAVTGNVQRVLEMRRGTVTLTFRVVDDHFDPPEGVNEATISIGDIGSVHTTDGRATFTVPVNTDIQVSATKEGYDTTTRRLDIAETGVDLRMAIQRQDALVVEPANQRVVVGERVLLTVTNAYGEPVQGATVTLGGTERGTTDAKGELRVTVEGAGDVPVVASKGGVTADELVIQGVEAEQETPTPAATATPTAPPTATPTLTAAEGEPTTTTAVELPGFTALSAVLALALSALFLRRRR